MRHHRTSHDINKQVAVPAVPVDFSTQTARTSTYSSCNYSNILQSSMKIRSSFTATLFLWRQTSGAASQQGHDWQHGVCAAGKHNRPCSQPEGKYQTPRGIKTSRDTWSTIQGKHNLSEVWSHCDNNHHYHGDRHLSSIIYHHHNQPS